MIFVESARGCEGRAVYREDLSEKSIPEGNPEGNPATLEYAIISYRTEEASSQLWVKKKKIKDPSCAHSLGLRAKSHTSSDFAVER